MSNKQNTPKHITLKLLRAITQFEGITDQITYHSICIPYLFNDDEDVARNCVNATLAALAAQVSALTDELMTIEKELRC